MFPLFPVIVFGMGLSARFLVGWVLAALLGCKGNDGRIVKSNIVRSIISQCLSFASKSAEQIMKA